MFPVRHDLDDRRPFFAAGHDEVNSFMYFEATVLTSGRWTRVETSSTTELSSAIN